MNDIILLLEYLLPGFIAAWIFYSFTSYKKVSQFERVIQALIFTLIIQIFVFIESSFLLFVGQFFSIGQWGNQSELIYSTINAIIIGFIFSYFANNDKFHIFVRKLGITRETSSPSNWFRTFYLNVTYVVLHLNDERRIYGWPILWPSEPEKGYFLIKQPSWLDINEEIPEKSKEMPIEGVEAILINVKDVKWVEFMVKT